MFEIRSNQISMHVKQTIMANQASLSNAYRDFWRHLHDVKNSVKRQDGAAKEAVEAYKELKNSYGDSELAMEKANSTLSEHNEKTGKVLEAGG